LIYEVEHHFFVHCGYEADKPLDDQDRYVNLLWGSLKRLHPGPHYSGKIAIVGHSKQKSGEILDLGYLKCIDTYCTGNGWLTALEVESGRVWQADKRGNLRRVYKLRAGLE
jgi:serine/threonine protein phosphatase 1